MAARAIVAIALVAAAAISSAAQSTPSAEDRRQAMRHYHAGQELMAGEKFDRAAEEFATATKLDPLFTLAHYFLGQAYMNQQRYTSAAKAFESCIEACRQIYALQQTNRFEAERRREDELRAMRESVAVLRAGAAHNPRSGLMLQAEKVERQLEDAERHRSSLEGPFQPPAEALLALGSALYHNGQIEQAEFEWQAAVQVNPRLGEAHNNLAVLYMRTGRLQAAEGEMHLAEKYGVRVNPQFKKDLKSAMAR